MTLLVLLPVFLLLSCPTGEENSVAAPAAPFDIPADFLGMVHAGGSYNDNEYRILDEMNVYWLLNDCSWSSVEPSNDAWNFGDENGGYYKFCKTAFDNGKKVYAMMGYDVGWIHTPEYNPGGRFTDGRAHDYVSMAQTALYVDYVREAVRRLHKYVAAWGIWNEPDNRPRFWPTPADGETAEQYDQDYYHMVWETIKGIREVERELKESGELAADEHITIIVGAFSPMATAGFIDGLFKDEAIQEADGVAWHPYGVGSLGSQKMYDNFKEIIAPYGFGGKIWLNELGYPTGGGYQTKLDDTRMPTEVLKTLTVMAARGARNALWYQYRDGANKNPGNSEDWFGLLEDDYSPKRGAPAFAFWGRRIPGSTCMPGFPQASGLTDGIQYHYFRKGDQHYLIVWNDKPTARNIEITLPGNDRKCYDTDIALWPTDWPPAGNSLDFPAGAVKDNLPETDVYSISVNAQFFAWTNSSPDQPPKLVLKK